MSLLTWSYRHIGLSVLFWLIFIATCWAAAPEKIHLSWTDPINTDTTMTVTWTESVSYNNEATFVQYGLSSGNYPWEAPTAITPSGALNGEYVHSADITGLAPDTLYFYRCGNDINYSAEYTFRTGPAKGSNANFRFVVSSDSHSMKPTKVPPSRRHEIAHQIRSLSPKPAFLLSGGDEISGYSAKKEDYLTQWGRAFSLDDGPDGVRGAWAKMLCEVPYMGSDSNHVATDGSLFDLFKYPPDWDVNRGIQQPPPRSDALDENGNRYWYAFNYGNAHFVVLQINTGGRGTNQKVDAYEAPATSPQYQWLKADLEAADNDPNIRWKFAIWHAPAYSIGGLPRNKKVQKSICRLLTKHNVDIAFAGHRHRYERSNKISNTDETTAGAGTVTEEDVSNYDRSMPGVVYITTGGAGGGVRPDQHINPPSSHTRYTSRKRDSNGNYAYVNYKYYNYAIIDIDNRTGTLTASVMGFKPSRIDGTWKFRDSDFLPEKETLIDEFTISKNIPLKVVSAETPMDSGFASQNVDVDRDHAFAVINSSNGSAGGYADGCDIFLVSGKLSADGSMLEVERGAWGPSSPRANVSYHVVQSRFMSVVHGSSRIEAGSDPMNRSITEDLPSGAVDMEQSMVILSRRSAASRVHHDQTQVRGYLTSNTQLRLERGDGADAVVDIEWSVVTFAPGIMVQTGEKTFEGSEKEAPVDLPDQIDKSRSWLYFTVSAAGGQAKMQYQRVSGRITNGKTLTFSRDTSNNLHVPTVRWYVVEFPAEGSGSVYHADAPLMAAAADKVVGYYDFSGSPAQDSFIFHNAEGEGLGAAFARTYWINRFVENGVEFERWTNGTDGKIDWQIVTFPR